MQRRVLAAAPALSLLLLACGGDGAGDDDGTTGGSADLQFCVDETNRYRAMDGKPAIARSARLEEYATIGAELDTLEMRAHGHFGDTQGGQGLAVAENACPSWLGWRLGSGAMPVRDAIAECIKAFYDEGAGTGDEHGHYNNLMSDNTSVGCGVYVRDGGITIIQDFGP